MNIPTETDTRLAGMLAAFCLLLPSAVFAQGAASGSADGSAAQSATESECADGKDNDGDTVYDCGDADCAADPACQADGNIENSNKRCSDWIDNDGDGYTDCDDTDCELPNITTCHGSWTTKGSVTFAVRKNGAGGGSGTGGTSTDKSTDDIPELGAGMTVEDLIGRGGDADGERNNQLCSDGVDNDNDGRTDCADFGCRFDPTVTICQGDPDFRFSVVARAQHGFNFRDDGHRDVDPETGELEEGIMQDTRFSRLQLRAFGPIPLVADSFFLLSMRAERTPRLTFTMFQVPLNKKGHYININSGTGGLSWALVRSAHKRLLLDAPFYLYNAFEQGTGAAIEVGGPIDKKGKIQFRSFVSGGTGRFNGNVGGRFIGENDDNYGYAIGGQLHLNLVGYYNRWDSPILYTPVPTTVALLIGGKFEQRPTERYPAINIAAVVRHKRLIILGESYTKRVLDWNFWQFAYNVQVGYLVLPKRLLLAVDFGEYVVPNPPEGFENDFDQETQWRAAAHVFLWRNVLTGSLLWVNRAEDNPDGGPDIITRELSLVGQYRF